MRASDETATSVPPNATSARRTRSAAAVPVDEEHERPQSDRQRQADVAEPAQHLENHPGRIVATIHRSPRHDRCVGRHAAADHERERTTRRMTVGRHDVPRHDVATVGEGRQRGRRGRVAVGMDGRTDARDGAPVASIRRMESATNVTDSLNCSVTAAGATTSCAPAGRITRQQLGMGERGARRDEHDRADDRDGQRSRQTAPQCTRGQPDVRLRAIAAPPPTTTTTKTMTPATTHGHTGESSSSSALDRRRRWADLGRRRDGGSVRRCGGRAESRRRRRSRSVAGSVAGVAAGSVAGGVGRRWFGGRGRVVG